MAGCFYSALLSSKTDQSQTRSLQDNVNLLNMIIIFCLDIWQIYQSFGICLQNQIELLPNTYSNRGSLSSYIMEAFCIQSFIDDQPVSFAKKSIRSTI